MAPEEKCVNCNFFKRDPALTQMFVQQRMASVKIQVTEVVDGRCHFNPPTQIGVGIQYVDLASGWKHPIVADDDYCSNFKAATGTGP